MDKRKEKYYNFIVDDLVKKTEIFYEREEIRLPFPTPLPFLYYSVITEKDKINFIAFPVHTYALYLSNVYGVKKEELRITYELYEQRLKSLIKKWIKEEKNIITTL
jgi:hypothetical protein|tara:strand:- start:285 stop:602 length:318 start_codon:yes stop_codon:yes gene_type:complete